MRSAKVHIITGERASGSRRRSIVSIHLNVLLKQSLPATARYRGGCGLKEGSGAVYVQ